MLQLKVFVWVTGLLCLHAILGHVALEAQGTQTLFTNQTPALVNLSDGPGANYELGLRFSTNVAGEVVGVRFWKASNETGTHTGNLWTSNGTLLASVTFSGETQSGWQQQSFPTPVQISANAEYVVSVNTGGSYYVFTGAGFSTQIVNENLRSAPQPNGVFGNPGQFPAGTYNSNNYFRDVVFRPPAVGTLQITGSILPAGDGAGATVTLAGSTTKTTTANASGGFSFGALSNGTYTITPSKPGFRFLPRTRTVVLAGGNVSGVAFTAIAAQTLFTTQVPTNPSLNNGVDYELGMRFTSQISGEIHAVRFWKALGETGAHVGKVWSAHGALLVSVPFSGETSSGWQEQTLEPPLPIVAGAEYVVSVNTSLGYYAVTGGGLAQEVVNQNLRSVAGGNGVYNTTGLFPTSSYFDANYFRDVVLTQDTAPGLRFNVQGSILPSSDGAGASVALSGDVALSLLSNSQGQFQFLGVPNGDYSVAPSKPGFRFSPPSIPIVIAGADVLGLAFNAFNADTVFSTQVPAVAGANDGINYELGMRFVSDKPGKIIAVRFWKSLGETGQHIGHLWSGNGLSLSSASFQNETPSGWQEQALIPPVPIVAGVEYVVSVNTGSGYYSWTSAGLAQEISNGDLRTVVGPNGVYGVAGSFPSSTYNANNYFRDVVLTDDTSPRFSISGAIGPAGAGGGVTLTLGGDVGVVATSDTTGSFAFPGLPSGTYTVTPSKSGCVFTPSSINVTLTNANASNVNFTVTIRQSLFTIQAPAHVGYNDGINYELGMRFRSDIAADIAGIRFWKSPGEGTGHVGKLWSSTGQLLASVTFANETAVGWQEQNLTTNFPITANAEYVVSVNTSNNFYVATPGGLLAEIVNAPLRSIVGNNGLYGPAGQRPTNSYFGGNYFRDVLIVGSNTPRHALSGTITPLEDAEGATVTLGGDTLLMTTVDSSGNYSFPGLPNGDYTLTPQKTGFMFIPGQRTVNLQGADINLLDFQTFPQPVGETILTTQIPVQQNLNDGFPYELGTKFYSVVTGKIIAVRFWKSPGEIGTHVGNVWSASGELLASVPFQGESASGWQEQVLPTPVPAKAFTQYTVSVNTGGGGYVATNGAFAQQLASGNLRTVTGINGAYALAGQRPWDGSTTNYFRDVKFTAMAAPSSAGFRILGSLSPSDVSSAVTLALSGPVSTSIFSDTQGNYVFSGLSAGTYTVTPSKPGFTFSPPSRTVTITSSNATGVNFAASALNPIVAENARLGSPVWQITNQAFGEIEGYAGATSVNRGANITFFVKSAGASYNLDVYRVGWYGGLGGRLVHSAGVLPGQSQPSCPEDPATGLIACPWSPSYTLTTGASWTTGYYVAKLRQSTSGLENHIWFVVRDDSSDAGILVQSAVTTMQAYNNYGGKSLYAHSSSGQLPTQSISFAASKVSFDRPFAPFNRLSLTGTTDYHMRWECSMVRWLESQGYDMAYSSNIDTHVLPSMLLQHKIFLSPGHDEYWSSPMRNNLEAALAAGTSLAFFAANNIYWQVRFEPSSTGVPNRIMVAYKESGPNFDPLVDNPDLSTTRFRDEFINRPENALLGVMYGAFTLDWNGFPLVISNAQHPVFRHTGLTNGTALYGIVGSEWDNLSGVPESGEPSNIPGLAVLTNSPTIPGVTQNTAIYQTANARVFCAGTFNWSWGLETFNSPINAQDQRLRQTTVNILADMGADPATPSAGIIVD